MDIQKYVQRQSEIEAVQITEENIRELADWCNGNVINEFMALEPSVSQHVLLVRTSKGEVELEIGYWLIKNEAGRFEGMTDANFKQMFQLNPLRVHSIKLTDGQGQGHIEVTPDDSGDEARRILFGKPTGPTTPWPKK